MRGARWWLILGLVLSGNLAVAAETAPGLLGTWEKLEPMPAAKFIHQAVVMNDYLYAVGGYGAPTAYTYIKEDGTLEKWRPGPPLLANYSAAAAWRNHLYVLSGNREGTAAVNLVSRADQQADGSLGAWQEARPLPEAARTSGRALVAEGWLYYLGGWHVRDVFRARLLESGELGEWETLRPLPTTLMAMGLAQWGQALYLFGGARIHQGLTDSVWRAGLGAEGSLGRFAHTTSLPVAVQCFGYAQAGEMLVAAGGAFEEAFSNRCWAARIGADGEVGTWQEGPRLPRLMNYPAAAAWGDRVYLTGGWIEEPGKPRWLSNEVYAARVLSPIASTPKEQGAEQYPVRFAPGAPLTLSAGWLSLERSYVQAGAAPVVMEAEDSTRMLFNASSMAPKADGEASGGQYVDYLRELENRVTIKTPGLYQAWYRAYFPAAGGWNHNEKMDEGDLISVTDSYFGPVKQWLWVKGPAYQLTAGPHVYLFPSPTAWCGGARLDKLVLAPAAQAAPEGLGPAATAPQVVGQAVATSVGYRLDDFARWALVYEAEPTLGTLKWEYSLDRGRTWAAVRSGQVQTVDPARARLLLRVTLKRSPLGQSPRLRNPVLVGYGGKQ